MVRKLITAIFLSVTTLLTATAAPKVKPGIEVLRENNFDILKGKRVGLITNPTGVDNELRSTIDILHESPEVNLVALFAPEHGVRGDIPAGEKVGGTTDPATGVKVYSLYGATRRPTAEMLKDIDVLVYDIQDNGCRSYTFISTMGLAMEQCARLGKEFVVLDRPNPLGGHKTEGLVTEPDCISFVSQYPIPYIYGLTPGELARLLYEEHLLSTDKPLSLTVVPMKGWNRGMLFTETGMPWVLPSPHIPSAETAIYYPATGIAGELDYLSIGVGYTMPFRTFAATWIDGRDLADNLNALQIPGVMFRPVSYKPYYGFSKGLNLNGVEVYVTDFEKAPLTLVQFYVMQEIARLYPAHAASKGATATRFDMFDKVCGSKDVRRKFFQRHKVEDIETLWSKGLEEFNKTKKHYHIY
ncbi:MAG: DUF1343 domain-containing protein [Bacteroidales bacterium]|nr:DUF1343 domain-containing protein [Bacteroidales bacterium]